jgi:hypothetical protein
MSWSRASKEVTRHDYEAIVQETLNEPGKIAAAYTVSLANSQLCAYSGPS